MIVNKKIYKYTSIISLAIVVMLVGNLITPIFTMAEETKVKGFLSDIEFNEDEDTLTIKGVLPEGFSNYKLYWSVGDIPIEKLPENATDEQREDKIENAINWSNQADHLIADVISSDSKEINSTVKAKNNRATEYKYNALCVATAEDGSRVMQIVQKTIGAKKETQITVNTDTTGNQKNVNNPVDETKQVVTQIEEPEEEEVEEELVQEEAKPEEPKQEEQKQEEPKPEEPKQEEQKQEELKLEESKQEEQKQEGQKETKLDEVISVIINSEKEMYEDAIDENGYIDIDKVIEKENDANIKNENVKSNENENGETVKIDDEKEKTTISDNIFGKIIESTENVQKVEKSEDSNNTGKVGVTEKNENVDSKTNLIDTGMANKEIPQTGTDNTFTMISILFFACVSAISFVKYKTVKE